MSERDKFIIKVTGIHVCNRYCTHEGVFNGNFSTWNGFGKLWEWAQKQDWWPEFLIEIGCGEYVFNDYRTDSVFQTNLSSEIIHPDRFANAVYEFLKERQP